MTSSPWLLIPVAALALLSTDPLLADYDDAMSLVRKQDFESALTELRVLAEKGDVRAQVELGRSYARGRGTPRDDVEAARWYRKAAEASSQEGQYLLGYMYSKGRGVELDQAAAVDWYRRAAERGHTQAQYALGYMFELGLGTPKDLSQAAAWYRKAAENDDDRAQYSLGRLLEAGKGVEKNLEEAMSWYRKAADSGHGAAANEVGVLYWNGKEIARDDVTAVKWFRRGAELEDANAQTNLGYAYLRGRGVAEDLAAANKSFLEGAENENAVAQLELGVSYARGRGMPVDYSKAAIWYRKAAEKGNAQAQANLAFALREGRGVDRNDDSALDWYRKSAASGNATGMFGIGVMYQLDRVSGGNGMSDAIPWFRKAAEAGNADAQARLGAALALGLGVAVDDAEAKKWLQLAQQGGNKEAGEFLRATYGEGDGKASPKSADTPERRLGVLPGTPAYDALREALRESLRDPATLAALSALRDRRGARGSEKGGIDEDIVSYYSDQDLQSLIRLIAVHIRRAERPVCVAFARADENAFGTSFLQASSREEIKQLFTLTLRALVRWSSNEPAETMPTQEQTAASIVSMLAALPSAQRELVSTYFDEAPLLSDDDACQAIKVIFEVLGDLPGPAGRSLRRSLLIRQMHDMPAMFDALQG